MPNFRFSQRSLRNLASVHPHLRQLAFDALANSPLDFVITEGLRDRERQRALYKAGATRTMNSRHLTGHALDFAVLVQGIVRWDWPLYETVGRIFEHAAAETHVPIIWGGRWETLRDGPHIELARSAYP